MQARLVLSSSGSRRLQVARQWLEEKPVLQEVVVLAPSRGAADDLLRSCCGAGGVFGVHRATLTQFANELAAASLAGKKQTPVSSLGMEALVTRCVHGARADAELDYFAPVAGLPGFPRALAATLSELRMEGVASEALEDAGAGGRDLARLLRRYEAELVAWSLVDLAAILEEAAQLAGEEHRLLGLGFLLLDLAPRCQAESHLLQSVLARAPAVLATLPVGDEDGLEALQVLLGSRGENLDEGGNRVPQQDRLSQLERLRSFVFRPDVPCDSASQDGGDTSVEFFSAPGEGRECVEIARRIRDLAQAGVDFDRVAILLRDPAAYLPLVEDALRRGGIEAYFTRGTARPDPAGRAFLALLACAAEDLSASRFAEYLSLGQVPHLDERGAPPRKKEIPWVEPQGEQLVLKTFVELPGDEDPARSSDLDDPASEVLETAEDPVLAGTLRVPFQWESLLVDASVVGGLGRWARRLGGLEKEIRLKIAEVEDEEEGRREHLERQLERLGNLQRFALPVIQALADLPTSAPWGRWLDALEEICVMVLRRPEVVLSLLAELRPMEEVGPVELDQVQAVLTERLSFLRTEPPQRRYGRIFIGTIPEAVGRSFDTVFLPGLAEGIFPRKTMEDPLLLDGQRRAVHPHLAVQETRVQRERLLLRIAAGCASSRLVASYPRVDVHRGRSRVPSFYALDLLRAAEGRLPDVRGLEKRAALASASRLGWPAPADSDAAIDDTEYDLALLDPLLHPAATDADGPTAGDGRSSKRQGQGRFLLLCNPRLARSLRTRFRRWQRGWSEADGIVDPDAATLKVLDGHLPHKRGYSPTALQHYAACPYRFLLQAIHRLRPRDELATLEQLDPLTRGSLFHQTQFRLFGELMRAGLLPMREEALPRLLDLADGVLDGTSEEFRDELAPAIPRVWRDEIESLRTDLRGWIRKVVESEEGWRPILAEFAFGMPADEDRDPSSVEEEAVLLGGSVRLRGAIDLVEIHPDRHQLRVTDHKTGRAPGRGEVTVGGGQVLQPVLYALAAQELVARQDEVVESGRLFFCTQRGQYEVVEVPLTERSRESVQEVIRTIDKSIKDGFLPAAPNDRACSFCDYQRVCGPLEELRVRRKKPHRLEDLANLRRLR